MNPDLPDTVINKQPSSVIADLMGVMDHIITEGERGSIPKRNFSTETPKASLNDFLRVPKDGENLNLSPQS